MTAHAILGIALLVLQASLLVPLIYGLHKRGSGKGFSLVGEAIWVVAGIGWLVYGYMIDSIVLMCSGTLAFLGSTIVSLMIYKSMSPREMRNTAVAVVVTTVSFVVFTLLMGEVGLALALSIFGVVQFLPQMIKSVRFLMTAQQSSDPLLGTFLRSVYTLTWAVYAGAWFLWGMRMQDVNYPLMVWGLSGFVAFGLQWLVAWRSRKIAKPGAESLQKST